MIDILTCAYLLLGIPLFCAIALILIKLFYKKRTSRLYFFSSLGANFLTVILSLILLVYTITYQGFSLEDNNLICAINNILIYFGIYFDNLSCIFILALTFLFFIVNLFSYRYLCQNRQGFGRFYIYLNLFQFFSTCFIVSSNLIQSSAFLFFTTLLQYLFANFYFQKPKAQSDSKKVFQINISADVVILAASVAFLCFSMMAQNSQDIPTLGFNNINSLGLYSFASISPVFFIIICLMFVLASLIKSSQFPFISRTFCAANAPNPFFTIFLSPIILAEGLYLLIRLYPILNLAPFTFEIIKIVGIITAFIASFIALKENSIKSLISSFALVQTSVALCLFGFRLVDCAIYYYICQTSSLMLMAYSLNALSLYTGGQENIRFLGGLREKLLPVAVFYLIGSISLCGFLFSGLWARISLENYMFNQGNFAFLIFSFVLTLLCAFYTFRVYFRIFEGEYRGTYEVQKQSKLMTFSLVLLSLLCILIGYILKNYSGTLITMSSQDLTKSSVPLINIIGFIAAMTGYILAYRVYFTKELSSVKNITLRKICANHFGAEAFIEFKYKTLPEFLGKVFNIFEKYILEFLYLIPSLITRILSYILCANRTGKISSRIFGAIFTIVILAIIIVIFYFKMGVNG